MWILWKMRLWNCEFCENEALKLWILWKKMRFWKCNFLDKLRILARVWNSKVNNELASLTSSPRQFDLTSIQFGFQRVYCKSYPPSIKVETWHRQKEEDSFSTGFFHKSFPSSWLFAPQLKPRDARKLREERGWNDDDNGEDTHKGNWTQKS